jgi:hypothetical protein
MGELARIGIVKGRKIAADKLLPREGIAIEPFVEKCLRELGCEPMVRPLLDRKPLSAEQVYYLLFDAPLAALAKLVEVFFGPPDSLQLPRALVMMPIESWYRDSSYKEATDAALRFLRAVPFSEIDVVVEWADFQHFDRLLEIVEELSRRRSGARFIGPSVEEMVAWLRGGAQGTKGSVSPGDVSPLVDDLLYALRKSGFYRLRFSSSLQLAVELDLPVRLREAGFVAVFGTPVDCGGDSSSGRSARAALSTDLSRMSSDELGVGDWDVWLPTVSHSFEGLPQKDPLMDLRLLRLLAVGSLCLGRTPVRRASSSFLSLDGLAMAKYFGANDLGYGGLDDGTVSMLSLSPYRSLMQALSK